MKKVEEDIREKIARHISGFRDWDGARQHIKDGWLHKADQILNLTYNGFSIKTLIETALTVKEGQCLGVLNESVRLPIRFLHPDDKPNTSYDTAQQDMLNAKFRQVTLMVYRQEGKDGS